MATKKPRETCENSKHVTEATTPKKRSESNARTRKTRNVKLLAGAAKRKRENREENARGMHHFKGLTRKLTRGKTHRQGPKTYERR